MTRATTMMTVIGVVLVGALAAQDIGRTPGSFPLLEGPYLGQKPPGNLPQLFAPGIVSTGMDDLNAVFSADGTEFFFAVKLPTRGRHVMLAMNQERGRWSAPAVLPFSGQYNDADPALSPDGTTLYFASSRPMAAGAPEKDWDIWAAERTANGWGQPRRLDAPVNSQAMEVYPSVTANGTLYFSSSRHESRRHFPGRFRGRPLSERRRVRRSDRVRVRRGRRIHCSRRTDDHLLVEPGRRVWQQRSVRQLPSQRWHMGGATEPRPHDQLTVPGVLSEPLTRWEVLLLLELQAAG
jgi:hypothetical protein